MIAAAMFVGAPIANAEYAGHARLKQWLQSAA